MKKIVNGSILISIMIIGISWFYSEVQRKQDLTNTMHNLRFIYNSINSDKEKNGYYPKPQSLKSLLNTLNLSEKRFFKTRIIDILTAVYHAPNQNTEFPFLTIEVKPTLLRRQRQRIVMKNDEAYYENVSKN